MAANKTVETDADVMDFVAGVADPSQRADMRVPSALQELTSAAFPAKPEDGG